jgi:hypothetical protein
VAARASTAAQRWSSHAAAASTAVLRAEFASRESAAVDATAPTDATAATSGLSPTGPIIRRIDKTPVSN